ncbi:hypothetical protein ZWY2020_051984 [Hordeum vulgare]|nr:hypothetical protein ZWY2020_051984 [Hordeum vulgare]
MLAGRLGQGKAQPTSMLGQRMRSRKELANPISIGSRTRVAAAASGKRHARPGRGKAHGGGDPPDLVVPGRNRAPQGRRRAGPRVLSCGSHGSGVATDETGEPFGAGRRLDGDPCGGAERSMARRDPRTKILPSTTRRGKELSSSSALDSPSVLSKFATSPPARNIDMSPMPHDAMLDTMPDDAMFDDAMLDTALPLGAFLDAHIARVAARCDDTSETVDTIEVEPATMPVMPDTRYVMEGEIAEDFLTCKDSYDVEKLLRKWKEKSLNARMKYDPKFATSPIFLTDKDYEFSVDLELITLVESDPFHGYESETVVAHLTKLHDIATLFTSEEKIHHYYMLKLFPFSLKDDAKTWFTSLAPSCVRSPQDMVYYFSEKYFPAHKKQAALQEIYSFAQAEEESLPQAWGRLIQLLNALSDHPLEKNEILDIFYDGLTDASKDHLDSCAGSVFRERTVEQAEILLNNILCNENAWTIPEPPPKPTPKKRGILFLSPEDMQEAKKSMREKGIKSEDVTNLPPIKEIHGLDNPIQVLEVISLCRFGESDIPFDKPASLCLDEFDNFIVKQQSFNDYGSRQLEKNARMLSHLSACVDRNVNDLKLLSKHASMVTTQV